MSEPIDSGGELDDGRKDALLEAFRQFSGVAATAAKAAYGAPVTFEMQLSGVLDWTPASAATISFRAPSVEPVAIQFLLSERIVAALEQARDRAAAANAGAATRPAEAPGATASSVTPKSAGELNQPNNLNLLLDVTLDAHLRFGQREMLLRDILELRAGSVVELDRRLQEPAELLVSGRVVARGDVVIVDGSYGIRIRDIVQPRERLESVKT